MFSFHVSFLFTAPYSLFFYKMWSITLGWIILDVLFSIQLDYIYFILAVDRRSSIVYNSFIWIYFEWIINCIRHSNERNYGKYTRIDCIRTKKKVIQKKISYFLYALIYKTRINEERKQFIYLPKNCTNVFFYTRKYRLDTNFPILVFTHQRKIVCQKLNFFSGFFLRVCGTKYFAICEKQSLDCYL